MKLKHFWLFLQSAFLALAIGARMIWMDLSYVCLLLTGSLCAAMMGNDAKIRELEKRIDEK